MECYTNKSYLRHGKPLKLLVNVSSSQTAEHQAVAKKLYDVAKITQGITKAALVGLRNRYVEEI